MLYEVITDAFAFAEADRDSMIDADAIAQQAMRGAEVERNNFV